MGNPTVQVYPSACATSKGSNSQTTAAVAAPKPEDGSMVVRAEVERLNRVKPITVCPNQEVGAPVKELIGPLSAAEAKRTKGSSISKTKHTRHPDFTSNIGPYRTGWSKTSVLVIYNPWKRNISSLPSTFWLVCLTTAAMSLAGFLLEQNDSFLSLPFLEWLLSPHRWPFHDAKAKRNNMKHHRYMLPIQDIALDSGLWDIWDSYTILSFRLLRAAARACGVTAQHFEGIFHKLWFPTAKAKTKSAASNRL